MLVQHTPDQLIQALRFVKTLYISLASECRATFVNPDNVGMASTMPTLEQLSQALSFATAEADELVIIEGMLDRAGIPSEGLTLVERMAYCIGGGRNKKASGRLLDGRTWDEYPSMAVPT